MEGAIIFCVTSGGGLLCTTQLVALRQTLDSERKSQTADAAAISQLSTALTTTRTQFAARALAALQSQHIAATAEERADGHELQTQTVQAVYLH